MNNLKTLAATCLGAASTLALAAGAAAQDAGESVSAAPVTDTIVVRGVNIPDEKRATSEISAVLDEAAFDRQGDSDIGAALRRVTGLTLNDGKFVVVRGLNERYSQATVNGSPLPSPQPLRRIVPLDLIPTAVLSGAVVQKTYSPQFSAEFGGGLIELRTKKLPDENFFEATVSGSIDTATSFSKGLLYDGGDLDWLGFDDGTRSRPTVNGVSSFDVGRQSGLDDATNNAIDLSLNNGSELNLITENSIAPDWGIDLAGGQRFDTDGEMSFGYVIALNLKNEWQTREGIRQLGQIPNADGSAFVTNAEKSRDTTFVGTQNDVGLNGLLSAGLEFNPDHEIGFTALILRKTSKEARITKGFTDGLEGDEEAREFIEEKTEFFERQVWQFQLTGDHLFDSLGDLSVNWRAAYGEAFRDSPYERRNLYQRSFGSQEFIYSFGQDGGNPIRFSRVDDENLDAGIDFKLPLILADNDVDLIAGYNYTDKSRESLVEEVLLDTDTDVFAATDLATARADAILSPAVVGLDNFDYLVNPFSQLANPNGFTGDLTVHAAYAGFDAQLGNYVRVAAGMRYEDSEQVISTSRYSGATEVVSAYDPLSEDYFLPAVTVTWNPLDDVQVRGGFSQTIVRPQFRELSPTFFINEDTDLEYSGNPYLVNSTVDNFDARFEYYFGRGQFITLGGFYKDIEKPIEEYETFIDGDNIGTSFYNAPSATLWGFEVEFERDFDAEGLFAGWGDGKEIVFKTNYTFSQSDVSADGTVVTAFPNNQEGRLQPIERDAATFLRDGRRLQGQSDHIFNMQLGFRDFDRQSEATILVNWASDRLRSAERIDTNSGTLFPAITEDPAVTIDFVYNRVIQAFGGDYTLGLKVGNILGQDYEATRRFDSGLVELTDTYDLGTTVSASLKREF